MRRRTFCASGLTALVSASLPYSRVFAAAGDDVAVMGLGGEQRVLKPTDIDDFRSSLRGQLLMPGANGYESARKVWNGAFDRKPALIARCAGAADVTRAVNFARTHELLTAVRGGGHSLSGQSVCDGGLMIDLSPWVASGSTRLPAQRALSPAFSSDSSTRKRKCSASRPRPGRSLTLAPRD